MGTLTTPTLDARIAMDAGVALRTDLHYAIVVGINRYPGLPTSLRGPRNDAAEFYKWLRAATGGNVPEANIRHVDIDPATVAEVRGAKPTRELVNNALDELIADVSAKVRANALEWPHTRLYMYLSGHGIAPNAREAALLMANAATGRFGENIPAAAYMQFFQDQQTFKELVVFADCCRTLKAQATIIPPPWDRTNPNRGQVRTVIGFAAGFAELAYEPTPEEERDPDLARGYFTRALLEGLNGSAEDPQTHAITSESLSKYVRQRSIDLTKHKPTPQEPPMYHDAAAPIVFRAAGVVPGVASFPVIIEFGTHAGRFVLSDGDGAIVRQGETTGEPWTLELPNGIYEVRREDAVDGTGLANNGLFRVTGGARHVQL